MTTTLEFAIMFVFVVAAMPPTTCATNQCDTDSLKIPRPSRSDLKAAKRLLQFVSTGNNQHKETRGGLLFDGTVLKVYSIPQRRIQLWSVKINTIYQRENLGSEDTVNIASLPVKNGGVKLKVNRRYRFFAIDLNEHKPEAPDRYYVWKGMVLALR